MPKIALPTDADIQYFVANKTTQIRVLADLRAAAHYQGSGISIAGLAIGFAGLSAVVALRAEQLSPGSKEWAAWIVAGVSIGLIAAVLSIARNAARAAARVAAFEDALREAERPSNRPSNSSSRDIALGAVLVFGMWIVFRGRREAPIST
ncbi:hypothetical protein [Arthrobacter bambusae]|jgi:hypothetical protein|uniref:hypothetical protein n=1 Tax=Arthrobacter bambusae TaxID=1338426 RepID=UPI00278820DD|nr:hypothetical protein [Arthrobacter bambusae]MDQ0210918.1 hypothetical protein [Arthrobacter bambusae]MDQ0236044.1 hypothetical protein [Arthrobacter bambusae]